MSRYFALLPPTDTRERNIKTSFLAITSSSLSSGSITETWADYVVYDGEESSTNDGTPQTSWICGNEANFTCTLSSIQSLETWSIGYYRSLIDYCLALPLWAHRKPQLQYSPILMVTVIACISVWLVCILSTSYVGIGQPLVTVGDAASSFLQNEDPITAKQCLLDKRSLSKRNMAQSHRTWNIVINRPRRIFREATVFWWTTLAM